MKRVIEKAKKFRESGEEVVFKVDGRLYQGRIIRVSVYKEDKAFLVISTDSGMYTLSFKNLKGLKAVKELKS